MATIDSQVHAYERNHPGRPWAGFLHGPAQVTGDDMVAAMDAVGVDGALLVSPYAMYRFDGSYALEVHKKHPGRFGLIKPFNPTDPGVAEQVAALGGERMVSSVLGSCSTARKPRPTPPIRVSIEILAAAARHSVAGQHAGLGAPGAGQGARGPQPRHDAS